MTAPAITMVPVEQLIPTPDNPRVFRRDAAQQELVESIRKLGILQPLVARPMSVEDEVGAFGRSSEAHRPKKLNGTNYDLRCGHRRLEAAKEVGLKAVPVIVREMDNKTAMEITVTENLQREDLSPLEEACGVQRLLDVGWEITAIADRLGKPASWVARRAKLLDLDDAWRKAVEDEKHWASAWSGSLLEVITRLPAPTQREVLTDLNNAGGSLNYDGNPIPTVKALEKYVANEHLHVLSGAPWKLDDELLVPEVGACNACPKRSGCQPLLFDEVEPDSKRKAGRDQCLDPKCFKEKQAAFVNQKVVELTVDGKEPMKLIDDNRLGWKERESFRRTGAVELYPHMRAKKSDKGSVQGLIVAGRNAGQVVWIKQERATRSGASTPGRRVKGQKVSQKEKEAQLEKRRRVWATRHVAECIGLILENDSEASPPVSVLAQRGLNELLAYVCAFGTSQSANRVFMDNRAKCSSKFDDEFVVGWPAHKATSKATRDELVENLWRHVVRVMHERVTEPAGEINSGHSSVDELYCDAEQVAKTLFGWDWKKIRCLAEEAIPTPRSWSKSPTKKAKAKGTAKKKATKKPKRKKAKASGGSTSDPALKILNKSDKRSGKPTAAEAVHARVKGLKTPGKRRKNTTK